jgi:hypothetical protein
MPVPEQRVIEQDENSVQNGRKTRRLQLSRETLVQLERLAVVGDEAGRGDSMDWNCTI